MTNTQLLGYSIIITSLLSAYVLMKVEDWKAKKERSKWEIWKNGTKKPWNK